MAQNHSTMCASILAFVIHNTPLRTSEKPCIKRALRTLFDEPIKKRALPSVTFSSLHHPPFQERAQLLYYLRQPQQDASLPRI